MSDETGDLNGDTCGLFAEDTRFLSGFRLTINGERPLLLTSGKVEYFSAAFYLRNPLAGGLAQDALSTDRRRFVGQGMQEAIMIQNQSMDVIEFEVGLEFATDFADIMSVRAHVFALGDPLHAKALPSLVEAPFDAERKQFLLEDPSDKAVHTQVILSTPGRGDGAAVRYPVRLEPRESWQVRLDIFPSLVDEELTASTAERRFGEELGHVRDSLAAWRLRVPQIRTSWDDLADAFGQSVSDLAALRLRSRGSGLGELPAAGMAWVMTVFGRDTITTCLQTLLFGPELARTALQVLADLQTHEDAPSIDAEPGKIVHEVRHGKAAEVFFPLYYGTVDATPLYLVLLSEVWRWTDDRALVRTLKEPALLALEWIDRYGDRDGDGFVEYERRTPTGLENQSWKDSGDSHRFADGRIAAPPIAPCEVQGYVFDAKRRVAEIAREVWRDRELAQRLEREAAELQTRFDDAFWVDRRGGYYALALDGEKRQVDSLCSNIGHLLWRGIVPPERVDAIVDALMGDQLWSGGGARTMSPGDAGNRPPSYPNGTVLPHDEPLIAWCL